MGKLARMRTENFPQKFLNAWAEHPRPIDRQKFTTKDSYLNSLKRVDIEAPDRLLNDWLPLAQDDDPEWAEKLVALRQIDSLGEVEFFNTYL